MKRKKEQSNSVVGSMKPSLFRGFKKSKGKTEVQSQPEQVVRADGAIISREFKSSFKSRVKNWQAKFSKLDKTKKVLAVTLTLSVLAGSAYWLRSTIINRQTQTKLQPDITQNNEQGWSPLFNYQP